VATVSYTDLSDEEGRTEIIYLTINRIRV